MKKNLLKFIFVFWFSLFQVFSGYSTPLFAPIQGVRSGDDDALAPAIEYAQKFKETRHENFNTGHGWVNNGGSEGTISDDTTNQINGDMSLKITSAAGGAGTWVKSPTLSPTLDLTNRNFVIRVRVEDSSLVSDVRFWISSDAMVSNTKYWSLKEHSSINEGNMDGEWLTISLSPADFTGANGTVDFAAINSFQVQLTDTGISATSVNFGSIGSFSQEPKGKVVLMFDDGHDDAFIEGKKKMSEFGMVGVADINPSIIGNAGRMTISELKELQDVHGWEIALQPLGDLTSMSISAAEGVVKTARKWMIGNGFRGGLDHYAYAGGFYNPEVVSLIRKYFVTARTAGPGFNVETYPAGDWHLLSTFSGVNTTPLSAYTDAIDQAIAEKELLIFTFHLIEATPTPGSSISIANFSAFINDLAAHIAAGDIDVVTMSQAVRDL